MAASAGAIHLLDEGEQALRLVAQQGLPLGELSSLAKLSLGDEKLRALIFASEPLVTPNAESEPRLPAIFRSLPVKGCRVEEVGRDGHAVLPAVGTRR